MLRFAWKHAMFEQDYVRETVRAVIAATRTISSLVPAVRRRLSGRLAS